MVLDVWFGVGLLLYTFPDLHTMYIVAIGNESPNLVPHPPVGKVWPLVVNTIHYTLYTLRVYDRPRWNPPPTYKSGLTYRPPES